ncbi:M16 family metallopeptidase [Arsukibacterium indicum]|uniref:Insulinase family protein n=1 Tax=Arsukibacterium indicum TaxID=2848612 RepID=A0ABS6MJC6_9GAMM|nr:pitrilysin family protein [Arsukibacterium indicum]MBV2128700.1 insulinase family protein [Arsukibacterium indicum]
MKLSKIVLAMGLIAAITACSNQPAAPQLPQGVKLITEHTQQKNGVSVPYKKYELDNGLTVIVHEDHSDPLVHVDVTYHVGSAREELGKSGFAHFFEHMMFQGSENVGDEEHFRIVTEAGGTLNGTTNSDRTNYFQTVPSNQLEKMLWLEADRMGFLLDAVTEQKFEVQRETVKNERGQRVDNRPYGRLGERVSQALYPVGHPYSWPVIGYMDDLNRANVNDVKAFFLRWYGPNNATVTIGGAVTANEVLPLVKQYFGSIPRGPEVTAAPKQPVSLDSDRYISMEDNVHLPLIYMSYPTVYLRHEDEAALDVLAEILGGGKNSIFYKNLVKTQVAVQANVNHPCAELACTFNLLALPHPASGKNLADIEALIRESLAEFEQRGVNDDDLLKVKAQMEANTIYGLQSVSGKVSQLAINETLTGNPDNLQNDLNRVNKVTKDDVMRVYNTYLKGKGSVIMSVVPRGKLDLIAAADNFSPEVLDFGGPSQTSADDLQVRRATDNFDRSIEPQAGVNPAVTVPAYWQSSLDNGISVLGAASDETPTTAMLLKLNSGLYYESPDKTGLSSMLTAMLNEDTKNFSGEEIALELEKLGSYISISAGDEHIQLYVLSLSKNLDKTIELLMEKMLRPAFNEDDFNRLKQQRLQGIQQSEKNAGYLASNAFRKLMYGDSILGQPGGGTLASVTNLGLEDVKAYYNSHFKPDGGQLIVVSDLAKDKLQQAIKPLTQFTGKAPAVNVQVPEDTSRGAVIYLVHKDDSPQSEIRIGKRSLSEDITGEYFKTGLANFTIGGNFNSRINLNLREDKGYTYGARTGFNADSYTGVFVASAAVRADATAASVKEFIDELNRFSAEGVTDPELAFMRRALNQRDALKYETPNAKLGFLAQILEHDLAPTFVDERNAIIANISKQEINQLAKQHFDPKNMVIVVVGDSAVLRPELEALGYPVEDLSL